MKQFALASLVITATSVAHVQAASVPPGGTITVEAHKRFIGLSTQTSYSSSRAWDASPTGTWGSAFTGLNFSRVVGTGERIQTFCTELNTGVSGHLIVYDVNELVNNSGKITAARSVLLQDLYARYYDQVNTTPAGDHTREEFVAGFQLAVWEIIHENVTSSTDASVALGQLDVSIGGMAFRDYAGADSLSVATDMIASLGQSGFRPYSNIVELSNGSTPDMVYAYSVVPTPAVAGLAGIGLLGMRRRRRR